MKRLQKLADFERRYSVWIALVELYLDTDLDENQLRHIAHVFTVGGYTWSEIKQINYNDVAPALWFNVQDIAGKWAGWNEEWLLERTNSCYTGAQHKTLGSVSLWHKRVDYYTSRYLAKIALYLP